MSIWQQGAVAEKALNQAEKKLERLRAAFEAETQELRTQIQEHKLTLAKIAENLAGTLADEAAPKTRKRASAATTAKGRPRKARETLDWRAEATNLCSCLQDGMSRSEWKHAAEVRANKVYSDASWTNLVLILKGRGPKGRGIKAQIVQKGTRRSATYSRKANADIAKALAACR